MNDPKKDEEYLYTEAEGEATDDLDQDATPDEALISTGEVCTDKAISAGKNPEPPPLEYENY